jgi:hypothetical protein
LRYSHLTVRAQVFSLPLYFISLPLFYSAARRRSLAPKRLARDDDRQETSTYVSQKPIICANSQKYSKINVLREEAAHFSTSLLANTVNNLCLIFFYFPLLSSHLALGVLKLYPEFIHKPPPLLFRRDDLPGRI